MRVKDWNGGEIEVVKTKGGTHAVCNFADNLIRDERIPWPPPPVVQKLYASAHAHAYGDDLPAASATLGHYSDLQSLNSEDAITWSYFGPFLAESPAARARLLNWLLERCDLAELGGSDRCTIDLWRRIPHPDKPGAAGGPELDVILDGDRTVVFAEAKWRSKEATKQGISGTKSQLQLRRDFLGVIGRRVFRERGLVVLGVVLDEPLGVTPPDANGVHTASIRWQDLAEYPQHPKRDEFRRYLEWKRSFLTVRRSSDVDGGVGTHATPRH